MDDGLVMGLFMLTIGLFMLSCWLFRICVRSGRRIEDLEQRLRDLSIVDDAEI